MVTIPRTGEYRVLVDWLRSGADVDEAARVDGRQGVTIQRGRM